MAGDKHYLEVIRETDELRSVTAKILQLLRPVEKEIEFYYRDVINARQMMSEEVAPDAKRLLQDIEKDITTSIAKVKGALRAQGNLADLFFGNAAGYAQAMQAVSQLSARAVTEISLKAAYDLTLMRLADASARLATFYSGKLGIATFASTPLMLTIWLEEEPIENFDRMIEEDFVSEALMEASSDTHDLIGNMMIDLIRQKMSTVNVPALGGSYSGPITNTGNLANSIGILDDKQRRYRRGKTSPSQSYQINVGVMPNAPNRANIYGNVLNRTYSSVPSGGLSASAIARIKEWGARRGFSNKSMRYIIGKISTQGTYGRNWFAHIIRDITEVDVPEQLIQSFEHHLQEAIDTRM